MQILDNELKRLLLESSPSQKTAGCLEERQLGLYVEKKLNSDETAHLENHLNGCLYCLGQWANVQELMSLEPDPEPIPPHRLRELHALMPPTEPVSAPDTRESERKQKWPSVLPHWLRPGYAFAGALALLVVCVLTATATLQFTAFDYAQWQQARLMGSIAEATGRAVVRVDFLDQSGQVLRQGTGVVIQSQGLVLTRLSPLEGARSARIHSIEGKTVTVRGAWADPGRDLAIFKTGPLDHPALPLAATDSLTVGQKILLLPIAGQDIMNPDTSHAAVISATVTKSPNEEPNPVVQLLTQAPINGEAIVMTEQGEWIGQIIQNRGHLSIAALFGDVLRTGKMDGAAFHNLPLLHKKIRTAKARNHYLQGTLMQDTGNPEEALSAFQTALELDPALEEADRALVLLDYEERIQHENVEYAKLTAQDIFFDPDGLDIHQETKVILGRNIQWLKAHPNVNVRIEGYADPLGDPAYNFELGLQRAEAVKQFLISLGVDGSRLVTISYGEARPLCRELKEECYARNRRVFLKPELSAPLDQKPPRSFEPPRVIPPLSDAALFGIG